MTKSDDKRVPALRFKGFTDEWEQRKISEIYVKSTKKNDLSFAKNKVISVATMSWNKAPEKSSDSYMKTYNVMKKGDIAFEGHKNKKFMFGRFVENDLGDGIVSHIFDVYRPIYRDINITFWKYYINSEKVMHNVLRKSTTSATMMHNLVSKDFLNQTLLIPSNSESAKIGLIESKIDNLITLQQRKLNDLSSMKSALLQNIFPNTQGIKKIKLSTQEWNLQKISSIFKERNQRNKNGMLLSVSISKGVYPFSENDRKDNSSNDKSNYKEVKINDLAYNSMRMWQGAVGVSKYNGIVSPAYTVITPKKEENPNFYYYYFKNKRMLFNFRQHSQGLTSDTWNLKFPLFEKILIQVPSDKEEEQRISSLFKQLDKSIDLNKIHIEKLTSIKQFLLQNMFI